MKHMAYDNSEVIIPEGLQSTQEWFASIITSQLCDNSCINPMAPSGMCVAEEAGKYIVSSPTLQPHQRVQIYNQQYWWRLLKAMQENFPLVTRLFGYHAFNETIAIPYLLKYPPDSWSLNTLGERLSQWLDEEYQAQDLKLIKNASDLDWAYTASFVASQKPGLDLAHLAQGNPENLLSLTFYLQPHIMLFKWDYNLMDFRDAFLEKDVDYWTENDFPLLAKEKNYFFILYRSLKNNICWKEISEGEYTLLSIFKDGSSIESACDVLEEHESIYEQAVTNLQNWLQDWVSRQWLTLEPVGIDIAS